MLLKTPNAADLFAALGTRTASLANPNAGQLSTILPKDVVIDKAHREESVKRSCNGLIFIDIGNSQFNGINSVFGRGIGKVRQIIQELTMASSGECTLMLAELDATNKSMAEQLSDSGIHEFEHTLIFKDFLPDALYDTLSSCLSWHGLTFCPATETYMGGNLHSLQSSAKASARTMNLIFRTIYQYIILREFGLASSPTCKSSHAKKSSTRLSPIWSSARCWSDAAFNRARASTHIQY